MDLTGNAYLVVGNSAGFPDIEYATGFQTTDPVVFLMAGRRRCLVVPPMEYGRAKRQCRDTLVHTPVTLGLKPPKAARLSHWARAVLALTKTKRADVPSVFPLGVARKLESFGIRLRISTSAGLPGRAVKTPAEVERIRESQQAAVIAMRGAIRMISGSTPDTGGILQLDGAPLTSEGLRAEIARLLFEQDCMNLESVVAGGELSADPHERGEGALRAGTPIVIDIFPRHMKHGYWGDLSRTVCRGRAPAWLRRMYSAVRAAQTAALRRLCGGVNGATVHRAAAAELRRRGFVTSVKDGSGFIHSTGHGVGLGIHEEPRLAPRAGRLRSGNVVTVEPGLYQPGLGGVRIEDTVVVTADGWRYLAPCEKRLEI